MTKRHVIVGDELRRYSVAESIRETLDELCFKKYNSRVPDWEIHIRKDEVNEFAAIYKNNQFFVHGPYSNISIPEKNLESMAKHVFNKGFFLRQVKERPEVFPLITILSEAGSIGYDLWKNDMKMIRAIGDPINNYLQSIDPTITQEQVAYLILVVGITIPALVAIGAKVSRSIINWYDSSKLTKEAESYNYGEVAEDILEKELIFEGIKSGVLNKKDFLKFLGQTN